MRSLACLMLALGMSAATAAAITNEEIRQQASQIASLSVKEPPALAVSNLLNTAMLIKARTPQESQRLYQIAIERAVSHPDFQITYPMVKDWMAFDPENGEKQLRALPNQRPVLEGLISFYEQKKDRERIADLALEAIRNNTGKSDDRMNLMYVTRVHPLDGARLLDQLVADEKTKDKLAFNAPGVLEGLLQALDTDPNGVRTALDQIFLTIDKLEAGNEARFYSCRLPIGNDGVDTNSTRDSMAVMANLIERQVVAKPKAHKVLAPWQAQLDQLESAAQARKIAQEPYCNLRSSAAVRRERKQSRISPDLALWDALDQIERMEAGKRLNAFWLYLVMKPRTEDELGEMVPEFVRLADAAPNELDPFWMVQSTLNLDGRTLPSGQPWAIPAKYREQVFHAAARVAQRLDSNPEQLAELLTAMRKEQIAVPEDVPCAVNFVRIEELRAALAKD